MSKGETKKRRILRGRRDIDGIAVCMNKKREGIGRREEER